MYLAYIQTPRLIERKHPQTGELELVRDGSMEGSEKKYETIYHFVEDFPINLNHNTYHGAAIGEDKADRRAIIREINYVRV